MIKPQLHTLFVVLGLFGMTSCLKPSGGPAKPDPDPEPAPPQGEDAKPEDPLPEDPVPEKPKFGLTIQSTQASVQKDLLDIYCVGCHSGNAPAAKLNLTDLAKFLPPHGHEHDPNGYNGRLCVPGKPLDSMLYLVMKSRSKDQMPPTSSGVPTVTPQQLQSVEAWITSMQPADGGGTDEPGTDDGGTDEPGTDDGGTDEPGTDGGGADEPGDGGGGGTDEPDA